MSGSKPKESLNEVKPKISVTNSAVNFQSPFLFV
jgi:hypothetical protein